MEIDFYFCTMLYVSVEVTYILMNRRSQRL